MIKDQKHSQIIFFSYKSHSSPLVLYQFLIFIHIWIDFYRSSTLGLLLFMILLVRILAEYTWVLLINILMHNQCDEKRWRLADVASIWKKRRIKWKSLLKISSTLHWEYRENLLVNFWFRPFYFIFLFVYVNVSWAVILKFVVWLDRHKKNGDAIYKIITF